MHYFTMDYIRFFTMNGRSLGLHTLWLFVLALQNTWITYSDALGRIVSPEKGTVLYTLNKKSLTQPGDSMLTVLHWNVLVQ